ncbi:MAG: hypothetical protein Ct9H90mP4_04380 [Gammaproteobacteria bacterium]|nr:MAG: hypothetical protein Ct9H90mP4_04380 [Gammaproteobacteria bacterium]
MSLIIPVSSNLLSFDLGTGEERPVKLNNDIYSISFSGVYDKKGLSYFKVLRLH